MDGSTNCSPVLSDGSQDPSDGSAGSYGGTVGTEALCSNCCNDEETVVLRFEKKKIDNVEKTYCIHSSSIVSSCVVLQERDEQIAEHEKL